MDKRVVGLTREGRDDYTLQPGVPPEEAGVAVTAEVFLDSS